jgi:hypothetical protein
MLLTKAAFNPKNFAYLQAFELIYLMDVLRKIADRTWCLS